LIETTASTGIESLESRLLFSETAAAIVTHIPHGHPVVASAPASPLGTGLTGEYFIGSDFQTPVLVRTDPTINYRWKLGRPDQDIPKGVFGARWTGQIDPAATDTYTFFTDSDSGTRVIINGTTLIDTITTPGSATSGSIALTGGVQSSIEVDYVSNGTKSSEMKLLWSSSTLTQQVVPRSVLFPATVALPAAPLTGYYYLGASFNRLVMTRADSSINFNWGTGAPDEVIPRETPFSVRWVGLYTAPVTGKYTFQSITDDGVRLWVNGIQIIGDWHVHSAQSDLGQITLQAGQQYPIRMDYFQDGAGHDSAKLLVALPGQHRNRKFVHFVLPPVPSAVTNVTAVPFSSSQIDLSWNDVTGETGFIVERSNDGGATFSQIATLPQGVLTYDDTGLTPDTTYPYEIIAVNNAGDSPPSPAVSATTLPAVPAAPTASATVSGTTATINWTADSTATSYQVQRSPDASTGWTAITTTSTTSYADTGLSSGTAYFYRVTASNVSGTSAPSNVVSVTTVPAAPAALAATTASPSVINLTWNDVTGETGFILEESTSANSGFSQIGTTAQHVTNFTVAGLNASTTYYFKVIAVDAGGDSADSNTAHAATTAANPPYASLTTLYGLTDGGFVYSIDTTTGAATQIGTLSFGTSAAGRDPVSGDFFYVSTGSSSVEISKWNPNDGVNTVVDASVPLGNTVLQAAFRDDGSFWVTTDIGQLFEINSNTGAATQKGVLQVGSSVLDTSNGDIAFAPDDTLFIETNSELYKASAAAVNAGSSGASIISVTDIGPTNTSNLQIAFGQNGVLYGTNGSGQLYTLNTSTGAATATGTASGVGMGDLASIPLYSELTVSQTASSFVRGSAGSYSLTVNNGGPDSTVGPITLVDTLPAGVTFTSGSGTGWAFNVNGQTVTMTYPQNVAAGASAPVVTLTVAVGSSAASSVSNTVTASTDEFQANTADNVNTITTAVTG
jgi:fibronectin type 3 domain-containing protein